MPEYSQGICGDAAAILKDGVMLTVDEIVAEFNDYATRLAESEARAVALRGFAQAVMEDWHEGDLDGGYRQELAERFGLLRAVERFSPCGENCGCSEYFSDDDWKLGQQCYRMTTLLTGDPTSDAAIDAAQEAEREARSAWMNC